VSYVIAAPEAIAVASSDLSGIGEALRAATGGAGPLTTEIVVAGRDEVSAAIAAVFSAHGQGFQALGAQAAAFHDQFVQALNASAGSFASAEAQAVRTLGNIFAAPAITPVPATGNPTFTGTPSLLTRFENATFLQVVGGFFKLPVVGNQLVTPGSPLLSLFANTSNIPGLSLLVGDSPPKFLPLLLGETVQHTTYDGMPVVQITPAHPDGDYVVAIHGGGIFQPLIFHWIDYSMMAYQTGATIEVPIYPLVQQQGGTAGVVVPKMAGLISSEIAAHGASHVSVLGDSAGGNIALASVEYLVANNETVPASMVLLSPPVDASLSNPNIASIRGSWLPPVSTLQQISREWAGNLPINNYEVSPLNGSLKGLPPTTVYAGSQDVVAPDLLVLQQEAVAQGAPISFVLANGETHDWLFVTPDTLHYWPQIDQELGI
jgi:triacylglycerol lipase